MKKRINFIALIITTMPFAFSKMEGPFKGGTKENFYYFLYDQTTGYTIGYIPRPEIPNNDIIRFLKGSSDLLDKNSTPKPQFYFTKEKPNLNLKEITELTELSKVSRYFNHFLNKGTKFEAIQSPLITSIHLKENFKTLSETMVENNFNQVMIGKNYDFINLHQAFIHNFHNKQNKKFVQQLCNSQYRGLNIQMFLDLQQAGLIAPDRLDFLQHNYITTLYAVIKNPYNKGSILWGLAEEKNTSKKFHWIIDLIDDISILTN